MKYTLKQNPDSTVNFVMESGKDLVLGKMSMSDIKKLESNCEVKRSALKSHPIQMGIYLFEGVVKK